MDNNIPKDNNIKEFKAHVDELNENLPKLNNQIEKTEELNSNSKNNNLKDNNLEKNDSNFLAILNCGHTFHSTCIVSWNKNNNTCPVCRKPISEGDEGSKNNNDNNNQNTHSVPNPNVNLIVDNGNHSNNNLVENIMFVQLLMHPNINSYNYDYSNGFTWSPRAPEYSSNNYNDNNSASNNNNNYNFNANYDYGDFGIDAGGANGDW